MQITWQPTNEHLHAVIRATDEPTRRQLYREYFVQPWQGMQHIVGPMLGVAPDDEWGLARAWAWPLPAELTVVPDALATLEATGAWRRGEAALHTAVARFAGYTLPFNTVEGWLMVAVPKRSNPLGQGYTGGIDYTQPRLLCQYSAPTERNLRALPGAVAHEFHHLVRLRVFPWQMQQTSVADYIIHEGLAESFATALVGPEVLGFYVTDIPDGDLHTATMLIRDGLHHTDFDVIRGYLFGDGIARMMHKNRIGMPDYGGYAVGYHVVQAFLQRTGCTVEEATFIPAMQIVQESGYFAT